MGEETGFRSKAISCDHSGEVAIAWEHQMGEEPGFRSKAISCDHGSEVAIE